MLELLSLRNVSDTEVQRASARISVLIDSRAAKVNASLCICTDLQEPL